MYVSKILANSWRHDKILRAMDWLFPIYSSSYFFLFSAQRAVEGWRCVLVTLVLWYHLPIFFKYFVTAKLLMLFCLSCSYSYLKKKKWFLKDKSMIYTQQVTNFNNISQKTKYNYEETCRGGSAFKSWRQTLSKSWSIERNQQTITIIPTDLWQNSQPLINMLSFKQHRASANSKNFADNCFCMYTAKFTHR